MSDPLHPSDGIRLLLERESIDDDRQSAVYRASIYTVSSKFEYVLTLTLEGTAELVATSDASASEDDQATLLKLSKSIARAGKRKLAEQLPPWPPRILRWRGPRS